MIKPKDEKSLYNPVKDYLQREFSKFGKCELEITNKKITREQKNWLDDAALFFIRVEKKLPDMISRFKPDPSKQSPYGFYEGLIIAEVKSKEPTLKGMIQTKVYAEVFEVPFAYLISSKGMIEEMRRFLSKRYSLLSYGAYPACSEKLRNMIIIEKSNLKTSFKTSNSSKNSAIVG